MRLSVVFGLAFAFAAATFAQEKAWSTRFEVSYVNTSGNTRTQTFSGKVEVKGEKGADRFLASAGFLNARDEGEDKANRLTSEMRYEHVFSGRLFGFIGAGYLRDTFAGYEHRISAGPGLGVDLLKGEVHTVKGLLSSEYVYESFATAEAGSDDFTTAKLGVNYGWMIRKDIAYALAVNSSLSLKDTEKCYLNAETSLNVAVSKTISIGMSYALRYQNLVPAPGIEHADTSFLTSLIVSL